MPEFDLDDQGSPFREVIRRHNADLDRLRRMRGTLRDHAGALADSLLTYPFDPRWASFFRDRRGLIVDAFQGDARSQGDANAFAPWDGRWSGTWNGEGGSSMQYHLWDATRAVDGQQVQPVTQSTTSEVNRGNLDAAYAPAVAGNAARVDLAINVWKAGDGITGWASRRQGLPFLEMPHLGDLLNRHTLVWVAQIAFSGPYFMFFEWVDPADNRYGVHGRTFRINGTRFEPGRLTGWTVYRRAS